MNMNSSRPIGRGRAKLINAVKNVSITETSASQVITLTFPKSLMGSLIGKGGTKVKEMREESGASIEVTADDVKGECIVKISGDRVQTDKAKKIVEDINNNNNVNSLLNGAIPGIPAWGNSKFGSVVEEKNEKEKPTGGIDWDNLNANREENERKRWAHLPELLKEFYTEHPDVTKRSEEEAEEYRIRSNNIEVKNFKEDDNSPILKPITTFEEAFHEFPDVLATINKQGFQFPSPIQSQAWPYLLSGKDVIGIAQTGTGKTLAFLLPAMIHIDKQKLPRGKRGGPNVLVLAPTRELAQQISMEVDKYEYKGIKSVCVYGGGSIKNQTKVITDGVEIIIATPGRFNDFVNRGTICLDSITYVVLDEADRMLDMGFEPQIRKTLLDIRPDRQTVMTSATWPENVRRLAKGYMSDPVTVFIGSLDLAAVHSVTQTIIKCWNDDKWEKLLEFLENMKDDEKVIVFVMRKTRADFISAELAMRQIVAQCIHGGRDQEDREQALIDLKSGDVKILIATDVASRGLDIDDITHVFNYDFPKDMEEYVHRVGRTGRAGKTGASITLWDKADWKHADELIDILEEAGQEVEDWLRREAVRYSSWRKRKDEEKAAMKGEVGGPGGRGGGGGDGCFKCGESGHFSRECPQSRGGGGGGGGNNCFKCGGSGHFARDCSAAPSRR